MCNLPGNNLIQFTLPGESAPALRHTPTGFDMNVVFLLLAEAQGTETRALEFTSIAAMLAALGHEAGARNRARLEYALDYWRVLTLHHRSWRLAKREGHFKKILPPPIESFECIGRRIKIKLDKDWAYLHSKGYFKSVPLPLPDNAAAQNLALLVATQFKGVVHEDGAKLEVSEWKPTLANLCKKIGVAFAYSSRREVLRRLTAHKGALDRWYTRNGLMLMAVEAATQGPQRIRLAVIESKAGALAKGSRELAKPVDGIPRPKPYTDWSYHYPRRKNASAAPKKKKIRLGDLKGTPEVERPPDDHEPLPMEMMRSEDTGVLEPFYQLPNGDWVASWQVPKKWQHLT